jgi:hypothetical protein
MDAKAARFIMLLQPIVAHHVMVNLLKESDLIIRQQIQQQLS